MPTIYVDNQPYKVPDEQNLLQACLSLGFDIPYFCYHPAMGSVGACRQCAVKQFKDEKDTVGKIVMSCMTPAEDGTRISIDDPEVVRFRASIIEWLMTNHPHDCPVCDEGGECHLQDMTVLTGHVYRRFRFPKRTYRDQDLGPFVTHEMDRCIQCYRCHRFYREYAGGRDFSYFAAHNHVYFGRYRDGALSSPFSGNLVEVCPTGVFTDKTLRRHYTRKWDLQTAPSICVHCGVGCNTIPGERYGTLRRVRARYHGQVNGYFLCDRGRYGYEFVNSERRIRQPLLRVEKGAEPRVFDREAAAKYGGNLLRYSPRVIGIGSPRASLEANYALRTLVGPAHFYAGVGENELRLLLNTADILREGPARSASLHDMGNADAVVVLGEDVGNTSPMMELALRQSVRRQPLRRVQKLHIHPWDDHAVRNAVQEDKGPLYIASPYATPLDDIATRAYRAAPDDIARLGFAVASALSLGPAPARGLAAIRQFLEGRLARVLGAEPPRVSDLPDDVRDMAREIAGALMRAQQPLVVAGTGLGSEAVLCAAANLASALCLSGLPASLALAVPECNSLGLALMGGRSLEAALGAMRDRRADMLVVLENDLFQRIDPAVAGELLRAADHVIVLDHIVSHTTEAADVVLPAAAFAEAGGTLVNYEGRAQRFYQVYVPGEGIQESWRWLRDMARAAGRDGIRNWESLDDVQAALARDVSVFRSVPEIAPPSGFRIAGMKIARQPHRYTGRTAESANLTVYEPRPTDDPDSALAFTMEGYQGQPPAPLIPRFWAPGWNSPQAITKFQQEVDGPLRGGDPGRRLIEAAQPRLVTFFRHVPAAFRPRSGRWLVVPMHQVFGSEELSRLAPGIAERSPQPYLALNEDEARSLRAEAGLAIELSLGGRDEVLPLRIDSSLPRGVAGVFGVPGLSLPAWAKVVCLSTPYCRSEGSEESSRHRRDSSTSSRSRNDTRGARSRGDAGEERSRDDTGEERPRNDTNAQGPGDAAATGGYSGPVNGRGEGQ